MKILITGAGGFVGAALVNKLASNNKYQITAATRNINSNFSKSVRIFPVDGFFDLINWENSLSGVDAVIHCAAQVHIMKDKAENPEAEFQRVNVAGTLNLAKFALKAGVKRFVFISSIKVNGAKTLPGHAYLADDLPCPQEAYARSKWEAEQSLRELCSATGMEFLIIRPPLVYGPGVKANFSALLKLVRSRIPLPLGAIHNKRSFVALDNLIDFVITSVSHPLAANQTFLVSDGEDVSTTELLRWMGKANGHPVFLIPIPEKLLKIIAAIIGRKDMADRLCGSLQVDIQKSREILGWNPPFSLIDGLMKIMRENRK